MKIKANHNFRGWNNVFNVLGEIKSRDPVHTARKSGLISLLMVSALFIFVNISYIAAIPREEMMNSGQLIGVLFFRRVFGSKGSTCFPIMVALSCFGNMVRTNPNLLGLGATALILRNHKAIICK